MTARPLYVYCPMREKYVRRSTCEDCLAYHPAEDTRLHVGCKATYSRLGVSTR